MQFGPENADKVTLDSIVLDVKHIWNSAVIRVLDLSNTDHGLWDIVTVTMQYPNPEFSQQNYST